MKYNLMQNGKERRGLELPDLKRDDFEKQVVIVTEEHDFRFDWHGCLQYNKVKFNVD